MEGKWSRQIRMMRPLGFHKKAYLRKEVESLESRNETKAKILRLPEGLHTQLVRLAGEQTAKAGKRVSVNQIIVEILEQYIKRRENKKG